jgi:AcrR family transcriptional regulator
VPSRPRADTHAGGAATGGGHVLEMQRRRLLTAFTDVLAEHGLEDARVGRVCARAGISRRTFYDLFDDREACFLAVFDDALERLSQIVLPAYEGEIHTDDARGAQRAQHWRMRVRGALVAILAFFDSEPALARACLVETLKGGPAILERRRHVLGILIAAIDEGREQARGDSGPPLLTADSTVGGALSVIHARLLERDPRPLLELVNPLMSMIVHPYLGPAAARRELSRPVPHASPTHNGHAPTRIRDPFKDIPMRLTFRTARVLATVAAAPGASNRAIGDSAGVADQGQISKLLQRLANYGLIENHGEGHAKGEPNAWTLTERGWAMHRAIELPQVTL